jgi:hypothetical protein
VTVIFWNGLEMPSLNERGIWNEQVMPSLSELAMSFLIIKNIYINIMSRQLPLDMMYEFALHASIADVISLCQGNKELKHKICDSELFWENKTKLLFPEEWKIKNEIRPIFWKDFYLNLTNGEYFPVFFNQSKQGYIYLTPTMSYTEMYNKIVATFDKKIVAILFNDKHVSKPTFSYLIKGVTRASYDDVDLWDYIYGFELFDGRTATMIGNNENGDSLLRVYLSKTGQGQATYDVPV